MTVRILSGLPSRTLSLCLIMWTFAELGTTGMNSG
jgi:hypothetical protein